MSFLHVAVGVIRDAQGKILIAQRNTNQHQGGLWEFPGGKLEPQETCLDGLKRELYEELGIVVQKAEPLIQVRHAYKDRNVLLDTWAVSSFDGEAQGKEGQPIRWVIPGELVDYSFPEANAPIVSAAQLPHRIAISGEFDSKSTFMRRLKRAKQLGADAFLLRRHANVSQIQFTRDVEFPEVKRLCQELELDLIVHQNVMGLLSLSEGQIGALHVGSLELASLKGKPGGIGMLGASCHTLSELNRAQQLGCTYAFLSPVNSTNSHAQVTPIVWAQFANAISTINMPTYALGGMDKLDESNARQNGGQGIAGISCFWNE